jgi:hypothetical protein
MTLVEKFEHCCKSVVKSHEWLIGAGEPLQNSPLKGRTQVLSLESKPASKNATLHDRCQKLPGAERMGHYD